MRARAWLLCSATAMTRCAKPPCGSPVATPKRDVDRTSEILAEARSLRQQASATVRNLELEQASTLLTATELEFVKVLPELLAGDGPGELIEVYIELAMVRVLSGDQKRAGEILERALLLEPTLQYTPKRFPTQLEEAMATARLRVDARGSGSLTVGLVTRLILSLL